MKNCRSPWGDPVRLTGCQDPITVFPRAGAKLEKMMKTGVSRQVAVVTGPAADGASWGTEEGEVGGGGGGGGQNETSSSVLICCVRSCTTCGRFSS